jgi:hypothetical protein
MYLGRNASSGAGFGFEGKFREFLENGEFAWQVAIRFVLAIGLKAR